MTAWAILARQVSGRVSALFGEDVLCLPQKPGTTYQRGGPDPDRPPFKARAFVVEEPALEALVDEKGPSVASSKTKISFDTLQRALEVGDYLQALDRQRQPLFEVIRLHHDNISKTTAWCVSVEA